jgi:Cthe_2314-like HEPN
VTCDTIVKHAFVKRVFEEGRPIVVSALKKMPKDRSKQKAWRAENQAKLTAAGRYRHIVVWRTGNLLRMFEVLGRARYLITRSPGALKSSKVRLNRNDWTQYHFLVFTGCFPSILDCCLLLVADTYQLGVPPRLCSFDRVTSHQSISGSKVAKALKSLRRAVENETQRRHRYFHRGEEPDLGELADPEWMMDLKQITAAHELTGLHLDAGILNMAWQATLRDLGPFLDSAEAASLQGVTAILDALLPLFETRARVLGSVLTRPDA